ncbi:MAG: HD domain-containing protein [Lachnospiraceae bacterium]|nr:HD domain-containing protein [Lachnospiraceae bacterium]
MDYKKLREELKEYVEKISEIRVLSAVRMDKVAGAGAYALKLREDYQKIGALGERCRQILEESLYPLIRTTEHMPEEAMFALQEFCDELLEPASGEELDLFLLFEVSEKLLKEFSFRNHFDGYAKQLNMHISVCYANVNRTARLTVDRDLCTFFRDKGLLAAMIAREIMYDRDRYASLSPTAKTYILRACRFYSALYDTFFAEPETNVARYQALIDAFEASSDPFYLEQTPEYPWELHRCRCLEHMGQLTERGDRWQFTREQCREINDRLGELRQQWAQDEEKVKEVLPEAHFRLIMLRNAYFAGEMEKKAYQEGLLKLYEQYADYQYDMYAVQHNLLIPTEYLLTLRGERISAREETTIRILYDRVIDYILKSVNMDAFNYLQEYLMGFLESFLEIPGVMTFEEMGLYCLAALHPPTYVHTLQAAEISRCLMEHLGRRFPGVLMEEYGYAGAYAVFSDLPRLTSEIYHAALCFDFGKLTMVDSIFTYGRDLLDHERKILKLHAEVGADMLSRYNSTRRCAALAKCHHIWYDRTAGYPDTEDAADRIKNGILAAADSIDAATDPIGRSYQKTKTLAEVCGEISDGAGTRYAPFLKPLLTNQSVQEDLAYLLEEGRQDQYQKAYYLLTGVRNRLQSDGR